MANRKKKIRPPGPPATGGSPMDLGLLEQIVGLMAANDLNTVDVRDGDRRVILKRGQAIIAGPMGMAAPVYAPSAGPGIAPTHVGDAASRAAAAEANLIPIKSPMVGTFYTAPKPGEKAYVSVGSKVVKDETDVCQIEAMKNFFVQKADVSGTVVKILVENGQPVQVEQTMFLVKPD